MGGCITRMTMLLYGWGVIFGILDMVNSYRHTVSKSVYEESNSNSNGVRLFGHHIAKISADPGSSQDPYKDKHLPDRDVKHIYIARHKHHTKGEDLSWKSNIVYKNPFRDFLNNIQGKDENAIRNRQQQKPEYVRVTHESMIERRLDGDSFQDMFSIDTQDRKRRSVNDENDWYSPGCHRNHRRCSDDGECMSIFVRCDGVNNCPDGTDELNCHNNTCPDGHFRCHQSGKCAHALDMCNGSPYCEDGSDEDGCYNATSPISDRDNRFFRCPNGRFVYTQARCDNSSGIPGCEDGSDDDNCEDFICPSYMFKCNNGLCARYENLCDKVAKCPSGSDPAKCMVTSSGKDFQCSVHRYMVMCIVILVGMYA